MNSHTPTNINAAVKQALRHERALNIIKEGYKFEDMGEGVIAVTIMALRIETRKQAQIR